MLAKTPIVALVASMASAISIEAAQLPVDAIALMFDNPDCSGTDYFKWTLHEGQDIVEADNHDLDAVGAGWHDRGEAIIQRRGYPEERIPSRLRSPLRSEVAAPGPPWERHSLPQPLHFDMLATITERGVEPPESSVMAVLNSPVGELLT